MRWLNSAAAMAVAVAGALVALALTALSADPAIEAAAPLARTDASALRSVLREQIQSGPDTGELRLNSTESERLLHWLLQQHHSYRAWRTRLSLRGDSAHLQLARPLPLPLAPWLNIRLTLAFADDQLLLRSARVGALPLPAALLGGLLNERWQTLRQQTPPGLGHLQRVWITDGQLRLRYRVGAFAADGERALSAQSAAAWFGPKVEGRLQHYRQRLTDRALWPDREMSLAMVLQVLSRDAAGSNDPVAEHTALLLALAQQESRPATAALLQLGRRSSGQWLQPRLHQRRDLAQHFVLAAALSLYAGDAVVDQLGLLKELEDRDRRGLDIADLLANRAGISFAGAATDPELAAMLRQRLAAGIQDADIMPSPRLLPTSLAAELENLAEQGDELALQAHLDAVFAPLIASLPIFNASAD